MRHGFQGLTPLATDVRPFGASIIEVSIIEVSTIEVSTIGVSTIGASAIGASAKHAARWTTQQEK